MPKIRWNGEERKNAMQARARHVLGKLCRLLMAGLALNTVGAPSKGSDMVALPKVIEPFYTITVARCYPGAFAPVGETGTFGAISEKGDSILVIDVSGREVTWRVVRPDIGEEARLSVIAWAQSAKTLVFVDAARNVLEVVAWPSGRSNMGWDLTLGPVTSLGITRDAELIGVGCRGNVAVFDARNGSVHRRFPFGRYVVTAVTFSPDSQYCAFVGDAPRDSLSVRNVDDGGQVLPVAAPGQAEGARRATRAAELDAWRDATFSDIAFADGVFLAVGTAIPGVGTVGLQSGSDRQRTRAAGLRRMVRLGDGSICGESSG